MTTSDNHTRTPKTSKKRTAAAGETPARKRTTKKAPGAAGLATGSKAAMAAPLAAAPRSAERVPPAAAMTQGPPTAAVTPASETVRRMAVATGVRPDPVIAKVVDADERRRMIAEAAYHKFLQRGPGNGSPAQDWIEAESEIDALLAEQRIVRAQ